MKFIPVLKKVSIKKSFVRFNNFRWRNTNKMFFDETKPGFREEQKFPHQSYAAGSKQYNKIDFFIKLETV